MGNWDLLDDDSYPGRMVNAGVSLVMLGAGLVMLAVGAMAVLAVIAGILEMV